MRLVNEIDGLENLQLSDFPEIKLSDWNIKSKKYKDRRRMCLLKWKTTLSGFMNVNGKCDDVGCSRCVKEYHPRARGAWHGSHINPDTKTDDPSKLARHRDGRYFREIVDENAGVTLKCRFHHDQGDVSRGGESLPDIKYIRILPSEPSTRHDNDPPPLPPVTNHLTLCGELEDPIRLLKHSLYHIDANLRGCFSNGHYCDYDTKRIMDYNYWSDFEKGDIVLTDDFSSYSAYQWNYDILNMKIRSYCQNSILLRIMKWNSKVCYGADEFVSKAAEERYKQRNHNEDDYVCKQNDFCFRRLAPIEYGGISGDHTDDSSKNFDPAVGI